MDNADFAKLSDADKKELQQFIIQENQNGLIQKSNWPLMPSPPAHFFFPPTRPH
jgi:hypothetical protein